MHPNIRKLAMDADVYCDQHYHNDPHYDIKWEQTFAEMIVRECCNIFVELRTRPADLAVLDVKKYFGVEE